ncbi:hypothetical protein [Endobacterium cereale]|uniref:hypothetical protein n=1 Tax=Endobacterium cereale TaxID=2663029 RepID=UPI002B47FC46|nr:hypothetical protein [Endobacterium cereale]MEB2848088.1 hypothetical protein [Endobacterium cereale]
MNTHRWLLALGLSLALLAPTAALSADFIFEGVVSDQYSKQARFRLEGAIDIEDGRRVAEALREASVSSEEDRWQKIVFALNSDGGSFHAGLDLASSFRRLGISTVVRSGDHCLSACAIAFLGGSERLKDPTPLSDSDHLPNQPPSRSLEKGAKLGFHAPYLMIPDGDYNSTTVQDAYSLAVSGIAELVALADHLYIVPAELPRLLAPGRDEMLMVNDVDALGYLGIDYVDHSYKLPNDDSFTQSMITNACVNRYYHLQRRSSLQGYTVASEVLDEFVEGSKLMENGEEAIAFGARRINQGTAKTWLAFLPIAKTQDGNRFIWCLFTPGIGSPSTFFKPAGTIEELFAEIEGEGDLFTYSTSDTTVRLTTAEWIADMMTPRDLVPPKTKLHEVARKLESYSGSEEAIDPR